MSPKDLLHRIQRKWTKLRLQPIRVFCLHHVCATFDAEPMCEGDWMQIDEFKSKVMEMQQAGVEFISMTTAYEHLENDKYRIAKYAVLTFDDGYASLKEILPWLEEQRIPAVLFINGKYMDGKSYRKKPQEQYLTKDELFALTSPLIEIGSHGWEHTNAKRMTEQEFEQSVVKNVEVLSTHPCYVPFYAYTYGEHTKYTDKSLYSHNMIPVYIEGLKNYNETRLIHRELLK